jgi:hypothetical protein
MTTVDHALNAVKQMLIVFAPTVRKRRKLMRVDTLSMGKEPVYLDLYYPRLEQNPSKIVIALMDVRAAQDIHVTYDFDRDGWVISKDMSNDLDLDAEEDLREVAFIPAWHTKEGKTK